MLFDRVQGEFTSRHLQVGARLLLIFGLILLVPRVSAQKGNTKSPHGPLAIPCENCHTPTAWRPIRAVPEFDHNKTNYPLRGMHEKVKCLECHVKPVFTDVGKNCADCHADIHRRKFGADCAQCHTVLGWQVSVSQIKNHQNRFPLFGAHAAVQCEDCHKSAAVSQFQGLSTNCVSCHLTDYQKTKNPNHATANFPTTCKTCHSFDAWLSAKFDHSSTGFLLTNGHANVPCTSCHVNNNYNLQIAPTDCGNSGCHLTKWQQTNNPVHSAAGPAFAAGNCSNCHTTKGWDAASFDHSVTGFTLVGTHMSPTPTPCVSCHINNNYTLNSTDCYGCHVADWNKTPTLGGNVPDHIKAGFPNNAAACAQCHPITRWADGKFDHAAFGFALTNGHANVPCASCHINNNYSLNIAPTDCGNSGCHLMKWQQTNNPAHSTAGPAFAAGNCANCHTTKGWGAASFDHAVTGFTLVGTHMSPTPTPCASCHISNNYTLNSTDCYGCHVADWNKTATIGGNVPNHITSGFPITAAACASCHPITTWAAGKFDHSTTGFALTNKHTTVACNLCHVNGNYSLKIAPTDCGNSGCHLNTWQHTNSPVHSTAGPAFAVGNCANCHTTKGWDAASFDHAVTGFTLIGTHMSPIPTPCASCHIGNNYTLNSADCYGCHVADWNRTSTIGGNVPDHIKAGFPNTAAQCASCHPITTWAAGKFDHSTTGFPLTGAHADPTKAPCSACHVNNNYSGNLPTDCYSCHIAAWQSTVTLGGSVPNHIAANFPTTCATCHNTTSWLGATFNHNNFWRLPHHNAVCSDCHIDSTNYANTSCINCHTQPFHDKANTDAHHQGRPGYKYGPMTCLASGCHPKGS
jgi:nitrate/TMAO reductase-like tetraheme cytochrome c subunit